MLSRRVVLLACVTFLPAALPVLAHHSLEAAYNPNQSITLTGTVTKIDWSNPHVHFFIDVKDADHTANWEVELGSPNAQILGGWKIDTVKPGDRVTVTLYRARNGSNLGFAKKLARADR
jgi:hypothetical protein